DLSTDSNGLIKSMPRALNSSSAITRCRVELDEPIKPGHQQAAKRLRVSRSSCGLQSFAPKMPTSTYCPQPTAPGLGMRPERNKLRLRVLAVSLGACAMQATLLSMVRFSTRCARKGTLSQFLYQIFSAGGAEGSM